MLDDTGDVRAVYCFGRPMSGIVAKRFYNGWDITLNGKLIAHVSDYAHAFDAVCNFYAGKGKATR